MPLTGMIAVDRSGGANALRGLMREGERAIREERQIVIFPEGTRAEPGAMLPLQPGVAALAARTRLPVVPVVTDSGRCWGRRAFHKRPGTIHIRVLEPIPTGIGRDQLMRRLESGAAEGALGKTLWAEFAPPRMRPQSDRQTIGDTTGNNAKAASRRAWHSVGIKLAVYPRWSDPVGFSRHMHAAPRVCLAPRLPISGTNSG